MQQASHDAPGALPGTTLSAPGLSAASGADSSAPTAVPGPATPVAVPALSASTTVPGLAAPASASLAPAVLPAILPATQPAAPPATQPAAPSTTQPPRLPLRRLPWRPRAAVAPSQAAPRRVIAGVASGLAVHLGQPVARVRLILAALTLLSGAGALLYLLLWLLVPVGDPWAEAAGQVPPARARLASRLAAPPDDAARLSPRLASLLGAAAFLGAAVVILAWSAGAFHTEQWVLPLLIIAAGAALAWSQVDAVAGPDRDRTAVLRLAGGAVLAAVGVLVWVGADTPGRELVTSAVTGLALVAGVGLVLAPVWLSTTRQANAARAAEAREAERADIAAHLHDSVLQTLTLIRRRADEPETVARLARTQERELRAWLYTDRAAAGTSVADEVRELVAAVEDRLGADVDLVVVGDRAPDAASRVVLDAAGEALSNAVRHGAPPVSVYAELGASSLEVFVRDRGQGFGPEDLARVPADRHGVRESILARMERHGGSARIRRLERGTEVQLRLAAPVGSPAAAAQAGGAE